MQINKNAAKNGDILQKNIILATADQQQN